MIELERALPPDVELDVTLEEVDVDGAIRETAEAAFPGSRGAFLRMVLGGGGAAIAGLALAGRARAGVAKTANDIRILNFDLALEYLQAGLYTEAERIGALPAQTLAWARVVGAHERAHIKAIAGLLGPAAVKSPSFNYRGVTEHEANFTRTAVAFEDLTAALLKWQVPRLDSDEVVAAALTLHSVEARHAAWIRRVAGVAPVSAAFDRPASQQRMAQLIASTRFVVSPARTSTKKGPRFTG